MVIVIDGKVRLRTSSGVRFLRSERWNEQSFRVEFNSAAVLAEETKTVADALEFRCEPSGDRVFVRLEVKSQSFVLGELKVGRPRTFSFSILSVAGAEVVGKIAAA